MELTIEIVQLLTILTAAGAACLWWKSAQVKLPDRIRAQVFQPPHHVPVLGAEMIGVVASADLDALSWALGKQSKLSAQAAYCAAASAALQTLTFFWT